MRCECNGDKRRKDLKSELPILPKTLNKNRNEAKNKNDKRKYSLSTKNSVEENGDESELDKSMIFEQNQNLNFKKSDNDYNNEEKDNTFDEQKARDLVNILLEDDVSFYKNLIPRINSFSYQDFKNLFEGNCEHNYNITNKAQILRLAHKFDNFYYILENSYREKKYYQYLKELWLEYPYIEDLKKLKDDEKILSNLSSSLPTFSSWPNDIKKDLIQIIKQTQLASIKIINKIKDEYKEVHKVLQRLANIKKEFSSQEDDEYLKKNNDVLYKDIETIYNCMIQFSKEKKPKLTMKKKQKSKKITNSKRNILEKFHRISKII